MADNIVEGDLKLVRNEDPDWDWWTIERAEHEDKHWMRKTEYGQALMYSGRIADACVEGDSGDMREIAKGILTGEGYHGGRCCVEIEGDLAFFHSPRNSQDRGSVSLDVAKALAKQIAKELGAQGKAKIDEPV